MGLAIITGLVAILAAFGLLRTLKIKNLFAAGFAFLTFAVFGWFTVMTVLDVFLGGGGSSGH
ncbi:DUF2759 domain-containing protein [Fictibacillus aquaticus]|uniref:DUF2759 domain-containing protein n=1 Tax=Fictibacillus aquaticus TaxID=2021314 RepID=A0A235FA09_9BACL|nr:DUF2759 domain-containing protein [Fictibacillus aquaticus]OYD57833.1 DUF2759 domain-containing protein [Fictibacillus aquaticus]